MYVEVAANERYKSFIQELVLLLFLHLRLLTSSFLRLALPLLLLTQLLLTLAVVDGLRVRLERLACPSAASSLALLDRCSEHLRRQLFVEALLVFPEASGERAGAVDVGRGMVEVAELNDTVAVRAGDLLQAVAARIVERVILHIAVLGANANTLLVVAVVSQVLVDRKRNAVVVNPGNVGESEDLRIRLPIGSAHLDVGRKAVGNLPLLLQKRNHGVDVGVGVVVDVALERLVTIAEAIDDEDGLVLTQALHHHVTGLDGDTTNATVSLNKQLENFKNCK